MIKHLIHIIALLLVSALVVDPAFAAAVHEYRPRMTEDQHVCRPKRYARFSREALSRAAITFPHLPRLPRFPYLSKLLRQFLKNSQGVYDGRIFRWRADTLKRFLKYALPASAFQALGSAHEFMLDNEGHLVVQFGRWIKGRE